ncbi:MAG: tetratricopeptide repeat protein [Pirellula sp.]|jgi:tetratricopeptide (TPR) repeat protein
MSSESSFITNVRWLATEFLKVFTSPISIAGSILDAARGWRYSRRWWQFFVSLPAFVILVLVYLAFGFSLFERTDTRVQRYGVKSEQVCATNILEEAAYNTIDFLKSSNLNSGSSVVASSGTAITELQKRYVKLLNERILLTQPTDGSAIYRLALVKAIAGEKDAALDDMRALSKSDSGPFPAANCWVATELIDRLQKNPSRELVQEISLNLKPASVWPGVKAEVLEFYARSLFDSNMTTDAISIAVEAAKRNRAYNLLLMRFYAIVGNIDGVRTSSYEVEAFYKPRLNTGSERVSDRLALAEANLLLGKSDAAASIVTEGLAKAEGDDKKALSRTLSNIKIDAFRKSKQTLEDGTNLADMAVLDEAATADPNNPLISEEVAQMLQVKLKPSRNVLDVLKKQIEAGITTSKAHRTLALGYYSMGNTAEAIKNFELAVEKSVADSDSRNDLAMLLAREPSPDLDRAFALIKEAVTKIPNNPNYLDTYGQILLIANRPVEAISKLEAATSIYPNAEDVPALTAHINSRKRLEQAYRLVNMNDLADSQISVITTMEKLLNQKTQTQPSSNTPDSNGASPSIEGDVGQSEEKIK